MFLSVKELEIHQVSFEETLEPGKIDFTESGVRQAKPLRAVGTAVVVSHTDEIRVQGGLEVEMETECDRCLGLARFPLALKFDLFYEPVSNCDSLGEEVAVDADEVEIGFYAGDGLELEDVLREQVLLALPMQRICRDDCKGICPDCGSDRNEVACSCEAHPADDRWRALQNMSRSL
jgi:uncharacterized protein